MPNEDDVNRVLGIIRRDELAFIDLYLVDIDDLIIRRFLLRLLLPLVP